MNFDNKLTLTFPPIPENVSLARVCVSAFITPLDPSLSDVSDIKTALSEAVTNAIVHGYENTTGEIELTMALEDRTLFLTVADKGCGMENVEESMRPLFTTKPHEERTGMGFTIMEAFMDNVDVHSEKGKGTTVKLMKYIEEGSVCHE